MVAHAKRGLRGRLLGARGALSAQEAAQLSARIAARVADLPEYRDAWVLCAYVAFRGEVRTQDLIRRALAEGKRVCVPVVEGDRLALAEIHALDELAPGAFGVPEPRERRRVAPEEVRLFLVPGVAFDRSGHRLGYGRGFFDRLLARRRAPAVGLAYAFQVVPEVPREAHDVQLDAVVTEAEAIRPQKNDM